MYLQDLPYDAYKHPLLEHRTVTDPRLHPGALYSWPEIQIYGCHLRNSQEIPKLTRASLALVHDPQN